MMGEFSKLASSTPEELFADQEMFDRLIFFISGLRLKERAALQMRFFLGCTYPEIGKKFGVSPSRAHQIVTEAINQLRTKLENALDHVHYDCNSRKYIYHWRYEAERKPNDPTIYHPNTKAVRAFYSRKYGVIFFCGS
jgi:Sigma-70, region 4